MGYGGTSLADMYQSLPAAADVKSSEMGWDL